MESPKSRQHKEKTPTKYRRREHKNKKFYNSKAWKDTRKAYMRWYQLNLFSSITKGKAPHWYGMDLSMVQVTYLLSLDFLPCESCLRLYIADAYDKVEPGHELDHIEPVNPEDAADRGVIPIVTKYNPDGTVEGHAEYTYGDPYEFTNLQYLCKRHHAKKSQRERD